MRTFKWLVAAVTAMAISFGATGEAQARAAHAAVGGASHASAAAKKIVKKVSAGPHKLVKHATPPRGKDGRFVKAPHSGKTGKTGKTTPAKGTKGTKQPRGKDGRFVKAPKA